MQPNTAPRLVSAVLLKSVQATTIDLAATPVRVDEPTPAAAAAGRYPKRAMPWKGLTIRIENEGGSIRRGVKPDGTPWETRMAYPYGEIARTEGVDGDPVDVFIGPFAETADTVFVIHQRRVGDWKRYDEDKCMVGWLTADEARAAFLQCYDDPRFLGPVTAMPVAEFIEKAKATRAAPKMIKAAAPRVLFVKAHISGFVNSHGTFVPPHEDSRPAAGDNDPHLEDDMAAQESWLSSHARDMGYRDIDDLAINNYPAFEALATKWRADHPRVTIGAAARRFVRLPTRYGSRHRTIGAVPPAARGSPDRDTHRWRRGLPVS